MAKRQYSCVTVDSIPAKSPKISVELSTNSPSTNIFDICSRFEVLAPYMKLQDILSLAQTNQEISDKIFAWMMSSKSNEVIFRHFTIAQDNPECNFDISPTNETANIWNKKKNLDHFGKLGKLLNFLTRKQGVCFRVCVSQTIISRLSLREDTDNQPKKDVRSVSLKNKGIRNYIDLLEIISKFDSSYNHNWSKSDANIFFEFTVCNNEKRFGLRNEMTKVLNENYVLGSNGEMEFKLRHALRHLFWNEVKPSLRYDWLQRLLRIFGGISEENHAIILFLMFGPLIQVTHIYWFMWDEAPELVDLDADFKELGEVLSGLHKTRFLTIELMDAIVVKPKSDDIWSDQVKFTKIYVISTKIYKNCFFYPISECFIADLLHVSRLP